MKHRVHTLLAVLLVVVMAGAVMVVAGVVISHV